MLALVAGDNEFGSNEARWMVEITTKNEKG